MKNKEDQELWKRHRPIIERAYQNTTLVEVMEYMKRCHKFARSKTQYERKFKIWGVRKNLTKPEWIAVFSFMRENNLGAGDIEALRHGVPLPPEQIERERKRYDSEVARLQRTLCSLPKDIQIRRRLNNSVRDEVRSLQVVRSPMTGPQPVSPNDMPQNFVYNGIETGTSSRIMNQCQRILSSVDTPFHWLKHIEFRLPSNAQLQHFDRIHRPSEAQLSTIFYPGQSAFENVMAYRIALLLNNMVQASHMKPEELRACSDTIQVMNPAQLPKNLPFAVFDAFRERIFVLAITTGEVDIVTAMLNMGIDPDVPMMTEPSEASLIYPLEYATIRGDFLVARRILVHLLRGATQPFMARLFNQIFAYKQYQCNLDKVTYLGLRDTEKRELACLLLESGSRPHEGFTSIFDSDYSFKVWMESSKVGLLPWLQFALPRATRCRYNSQKTGINEDLRYLLHERLQDLREEIPDLAAVLSSEMRQTLEWEDANKLSIMLPAMKFLDCRDDSDYASSHPTDIEYRQACDEGNWTLAASVIITKYRERKKIAPIVEPTPSTLTFLVEVRRTVKEEIFQEDQKQTFQEMYYTRHDEMDDDKYNQMLREMVQEKYDELVQGFEDSWMYGDVDKFFRRALELRCFRTAAYLHEDTDPGYLNPGYCFIFVLETGDASICSGFIRCIPAWRRLLRNLTEHDDTSELSAMVYHQSKALIWGADEFDAPGEDHVSRQICLRILSYHAIATNDWIRFKWLLHLHLDMNEIHCGWVDGRCYFDQTGGMHDSLPGPSASGIDNEQDHILIPSLLSVAIGQGSLEWIEFLCARGTNMRDSTALLYAVKNGADIKIIERLLQLGRYHTRSVFDTYGSAALRQALRSHRFDVADLLYNEVNIDAMELSTEEWLNKDKPVTPLGEAILSNNLEAVRWLLEHGADPNAYVAAFGTLQMSADDKSFLPLVTPVLAAINTQSLSMVQLLVGFGATIEDARKSGLTRTPLQRAAEMGQFDIVKYFIDRHALIDTELTYSGGTALQLAAMNGHVGIATLLLERGADPNHLPAKGDGRTAFEAAIEWGRFDMVLLLMRSGVDLDLPVGEPLETQYERARRFAEKNGKFASKRMAEGLYGQVRAHQSLAETSSSSQRIGTVDEIGSYDPTPEFDMVMESFTNYDLYN